MCVPGCTKEGPAVTSQWMESQRNRGSRGMKMAARNLSGLSKAVRELRIHLCQKSQSSQGVRDFIEQHYIGIKNANPSLPILIRECSGIQPKLYARFDFGRESSVYLTDKSSPEVMQAIEQLSNVKK